jgi:hypothetical protein
MINPVQFRELIVRPTLQSMDAWSEAAENLLMGTAMQESHLTYLKQLGGGPALGVYQMEPATCGDIWDNYLHHRSELRSIVSKFQATWKGDDSELVWNLTYATAMCRVHYLRVSEALPDALDILGLASYWKSYYNTPLGAGTVNEFIENYQRMADHG